MRLFLAMLFALGLLGAGWAAPVGAQDEKVDSAFSNQILSTLGYPEVEIAVGPDGVTAPSTLAAGHYLVTLTAAEPYIGYVNFMQPTEGLTEEEATAMALESGAGDIVHPGWVYAGGSNTPGPGEPVSFAIELRPGEYQIAASYYEPPGDTEEMVLSPLTVTEADAATPATSAPAAAVTLEMTDELQYLITPETVPAGPQVWEITNSGEMMSHHVVMMRVPDGTTAPQVVTEFNSMMAGTPPAGDSAFANGVWVGYAALQSGGWTTWAEYDLSPATYAVICFIFDSETGRPHAADGMVTVFQVA